MLQNWGREEALKARKCGFEGERAKTAALPSQIASCRPLSTPRPLEPAATDPSCSLERRRPCLYFWGSEASEQCDQPRPTTRRPFLSSLSSLPTRNCQPPPIKFDAIPPSSHAQPSLRASSRRLSMQSFLI